ncbi:MULTISPECIES: ROK family transcriptional regulator [Streptomyces]|uniref:ROK family transcriptional regulator n=1 Tax=Streptomyces tsukubensis (strain DSM 42081 / NBRC 108919 / NRRL 18488 / 9993) TaxID=1114943 RepID=I2N9A0_STRT9|nr:MULTISPECIES: ROK family transcriptional regulator [Streptomyces]AZK97454.1 sugar kinase [Streptomyces tsukubensis]EIF93597.1 ROK family transcriptional regulator [Streptomyces tsukubensis NRRL18488]MYS63532.1 ROK family protein [Streptomyces sp. SID5473]QKM66596.1 ROK family transcriptional regulator [Streptomyces tsukubensis NRRL18488]TAI45061.1 ROK family transcriptional regulator [Streptomyces tsukubensis]
MTARPANAHQARLLKLLRDGGPSSRAQLGDLVDLSRSKLAVEVDKLLETGLVVADGLAASRGGRRSHNIRLAPELRFLGVDIGATSVDVAVTNAELEVLGHLNHPMDVREGPVAVFEQVLAMAAKLKATGLAEGFDGAGIGVPGPVRYPEGVPVAPPIMPGWDGFPVREALSQDLGCPVMVDNDVNLMAMGEQHAGVARSVADFLCVKIGTGIGCGIVVGSQVYRGTTGSAGDIGHIQVDPYGRACACGNKGCLEAHFSGAALARDAEEAARSGRSPELAERLAAAGRLTAADVSAAASAGDTAALELIREGGNRVGQVVAGLVSFFNPGLVVIGGGVTGLGHTLLAAVRTQVYRQSLPLATGNLPIVLGELGAVAGVIGAARLISDHLFSPA